MGNAYAPTALRRKHAHLSNEVEALARRMASQREAWTQVDAAILLL
jgi:hypothetical protein